MGNRKNPIWRVVVAEGRSKRDGRVLETVGRYNPQRQPSEIVLDRERIDHWLARGAQPSDTVRGLIRASERSAPPERAEPDGSDETAAVTEPAADAGPPTAPPGETETPDVADAQTSPDEAPPAEVAGPPGGEG